MLLSGEQYKALTSLNAKCVFVGGWFGVGDVCGYGVEMGCVYRVFYCNYMFLFLFL